MIQRSSLGEDFIWGVSSSALQTEGNHIADGKGQSIWDCFAEKTGKIKKGHHPKVATGFYKYYRQDIDIMNWMNCGNFRFSAAWSRILPKGIGKVNQKGIDFYNRLIDSCLENSISPWLTIYHWDLPMELQHKGGWTNRDILYWFEEYIDLLLTNFSDRVGNWMVLNEPVAFTALGYFMGIHAPGKKGLKNFLPAMHHAALVQSLGAKQIKSHNSTLKVGTTYSFSHVEAHGEKEKHLRAQRKVDALLNRLFLEPILGKGYPLKDLKGLKGIEKYMKQNDQANLIHNFDFLGVQNYSREIVAHSYLTPIVNAKLITAKKRKVKRTEMGWEVYPQGIYHVLKRLNQYDNMPPLIVTESGVAFNDSIDNSGSIKDVERIDYYQKSIASVRQAQKEGVNVKGFFIWSLTDNFEWAEGYHPRFGLVYIDYRKQKRIPKDSAFWYKNFLS